MFIPVKIKRDKVKRICPMCGEKRLEWCGGKVDESQQEYMCRPCRVYVTINGFTVEDQETLAEEAFE